MYTTPSNKIRMHNGTARLRMRLPLLAISNVDTVVDGVDFFHKVLVHFVVNHLDLGLTSGLVT